MTKLSSRVTRLQPSATLAMSQKSAELKAQGIDIINLSVGEPDFDTPEHIRLAAQKAIDEGHTRYTPVSGIAPLRKAICEKLQKENGLSYTSEQIIVSNGAKQSVCNTLLALCDDGDEVIIPAPYWVSYPQMALMAGGVPVTIDAPISQNFKITPQQLEAAITERSRVLILCTPSNPTGAVYSAEELEALAEVLRHHENVTIISDEIYEHINYTGKHASIASCEGMKERTVIVNGVSKAYAMTGWRIGFIAAPIEIAKATQKLQGQYTSNPGSISQYAALAAYESSQDCVEEMRQAFARRKDLIVALAREIPGLEVNEPQGAFYVFPRCSAYFGKTDGTRTINTSTDFALYLLEVAHVATVGGDAFGSPECFRMSYATSDDNIREAMRRIGKALKQLK